MWYKPNTKNISKSTHIVVKMFSFVLSCFFFKCPADILSKCICRAGFPGEVSGELGGGRWGDAPNVPSLGASRRESLGDWTGIWFRQVHLTSLPCGHCKLTALTAWQWISTKGFPLHCQFVFLSLSGRVSIDQAFDLLKALLVGSSVLGIQPRCFQNHMALPAPALLVGSGGGTHEGRLERKHSGLDYCWQTGSPDKIQDAHFNFNCRWTTNNCSKYSMGAYLC